MHRLAALVLLILVAGCAQATRLVRLVHDPDARMAGRVEILRDEWGIAHVRAETDAAAAFGIGYTQAEDDFRALDAAYTRAIARPDVDAARAEYRAEPAERRALWDAYVAGIRYWLRLHPEVQPQGFEAVEPWFVFARARDIEPRTRTWMSRDASGAARLAASVHANFTGSDRPWEMHVDSNEGWHVSGAAWFGIPVPSVGRNEAIAFAAVNDADAAGRLQQWYALGRARTLEEFQTALAAGPDSAAFADAAGNIVSPDGDDANPADSLAAIPFDTRLPDTEAWVQRVILGWERLGGEEPDRATQLDRAIDALREWDGRADAASTAATLFIRGRALQRDSMLDDIAALERVVASLRAEWDTVEVAWGDAHRLRRSAEDTTDIPVGGAPAWTGIVFAIEAEASGRVEYAVAGPAWIGVFQPGGEALAVAVFGQSGDPASEHWFDQAPLFAAGRLRAARFSRDDVAAAAARRYRPGEEIGTGR